MHHKHISAPQTHQCLTYASGAVHGLRLRLRWACTHYLHLHLHTSRERYIQVTCMLLESWHRPCVGPAEAEEGVYGMTASAELPLRVGTGHRNSYNVGDGVKPAQRPGEFSACALSKEAQGGPLLRLRPCDFKRTQAAISCASSACCQREP